MSEKLLPEDVAAQLDRLAELATRGLDESTWHEIRAHLEDMYLSYVQHAHPLTAADAMLLVKEHFGSPALVRAKLLDTRETSSIINIARLTRVLVGPLALATIIASAVAMFIPTMTFFGAEANLSIGECQPPWGCAGGAALVLMLAFLPIVRPGRRAWIAPLLGAVMLTLFAFWLWDAYSRNNEWGGHETGEGYALAQIGLLSLAVVMLSCEALVSAKQFRAACFQS